MITFSITYKVGRKINMVQMEGRLDEILNKIMMANFGKNVKFVSISRWDDGLANWVQILVK